MKEKQKQKYVRMQIVQVSTKHEQADYGGGDGIDDAVDGASP